MAISDRRLRATGKTVIQFAEQPAGSPPALEASFYPGSTNGLSSSIPTTRLLHWRMPTTNRFCQPVPICLLTRRNR